MVQTLPPAPSAQPETLLYLPKLHSPEAALESELRSDLELA